MSKEKEIRRLVRSSEVDHLPDDYIVLDVETTGLRVWADEIIQLSMIRCRNNEIVDTYDSYFCPLHGIHEKAYEINHISIETLVGKPKLIDKLDEIIKFIKDDIIVGYNIKCDIAFLNMALRKAGIDMISNSYLDVFNLAKTKNIEPKNYKQSSVAKYLGIKSENAHNSYNDILVCQKIYMSLKNMK